VPVLAPAAALAGDVPALLRVAADRPGHAPLRRLAALWTVAETTGAGLADAVERLCDELDDEAELRRELDSVLAGPRASARLMALLPAGGVLLGTGLGGDPVDLLLHDALGQSCLVGGTVLVAVGLRWTRAVAEGVVR
jgi:tight adherence protein B